MQISACTSRSGRSRGSSTASGLEGASHCIRCFTRAGPFLLDAFPRWSGLVFTFRPHLLWRQPDPIWFVFHLLIDRHDFSYLLHHHCSVTSLRIIQFSCISWIGIGENHAVQSFTFGLHQWHFLLLKLGFSTKLHLRCLHLTRVCDLCHHTPLPNSGNVSGHHLAGSNKTGCWSTFVNFVASFSSVQFCHPCHLSSYSRWLCPLIWTWNSTMLSSPSPALAGSSTTVHSLLILQNTPPRYVCSLLSVRQVASV